ncbi:MAG: vWA domain-containing protein [Armatimonadota bacterium]
MAWKHPALLWLLLALGGLLVTYLSTFRRIPARGAVRFPTWAASEAAAHAGRIHRHLPAGIFMLAVAVALIGAGGPMVPWPVPTGRPVVLIIDVSRSMEETDIPPSRIEAAKTAALEFANRLPHSTRVALVSFGNYATLVIPLTPDRARLREGIRGLTTQLRTQLGTGLMEGVRAVTGEGGAGLAPGPATPAGHAAAVAVLLSDGRASDGVPPLEAAEEARRRGVRVYTVGVGTAADPRTFRSGYWGVLDEPTLQAIADQTGGRYFRAASSARLSEIYRDLAQAIGWERRPTEATAALGAMAMLLLVASLLLRYRAYLIH